MPRVIEYHDTVISRFPTIRTPHLELIQITEAHADDLLKLFGDQQVTRYYNLSPFECTNDSHKLIDHFRKRFEAGTAIRWGIRLNESNEIIGTAGFNNFTRKHRANIGCELQHAYWNRGITTEAMHAIISYGFHALDINRMEAEVMEGNEPSIHLLNKIGFKQEGTLRQWMYWNNKHYDMLMFSLLRSDAHA
ncbi:GNAT family N-acetyltransferase [Chitinophaga rhizophila]|uniref:GNAT family N-acetyltransferase n=1 Tax=Chitinophaga rhizophila TaxID=2866212 RepID=A0ABS7GHW2_9BACT|nr:GNAT family protein [Chitinophaga rhizophila]MBW8687293.1 GNAT family N-acetyltransferase [Chitinophaga rhizophila]